MGEVLADMPTFFVGRHVSLVQDERMAVFEDRDLFHRYIVQCLQKQPSPARQARLGKAPRSTTEALSPNTAMRVSSSWFPLLLRLVVWWNEKPGPLSGASA